MCSLCLTGVANYTSYPNYIFQPEVIVHACNSSTQEVRQEDQKPPSATYRVQSQLGLREIVTQQTNKQEGSEKHPRQPGEMAPQVKMFAAKADDLSSSLRTYMEVAGN